ncbi:hypothetical protein [Mycobacterium sp. AZCC_0083]|uniref:hypothetical protein n=1 Tax=Mycobacterium sp. AZCC_0083 TaxID=2735882 RepID=UPI00161D06FA|nr:hypothetical protein [Mycobacterium sp. AZCC_0083]MBB5164728.1 hypothetical protein [Mycobacterium sp. AZCC_0083]
MPGWFFAARGDGPKPTLVVATGADGALSYLWPSRSGPTGSTPSVRSSTRCCAVRTSSLGQPMARALAAQRFLDFLDDHVG